MEEIAKVEMSIIDRKVRPRPNRPPLGSPGVEAAGGGGPSSYSGGRHGLKSFITALAVPIGTETQVLHSAQFYIHKSLLTEEVNRNNPC